MNLNENLKKYAELLVKVGLNIRPGDNLIIRMEENGLPLAREVARQAYGLGAHLIHPAFADDELTLAFYERAPEKAFEAIPSFFADFSEAAYQNNFHLLALNAPNPELLKSADAGRISRWQKVNALANERLMKYTMENRVKWCVAALPSPAWAKSVFPGLSEAEGISALWEKIFEITRVNRPDPVAAWAKHASDLRARESFLNSQRFEKLLYKAPGTDLEVNLPKGHIWLGGASRSQKGEDFMPNIPTEEVFTLPHAFGVNGSLKATMPLSTRGRLIEGMRFEFAEGRVVSFDADKGRDILEDLLGTDEGASRLGEVALVPHDSPISKTGLLFKNTLYDENASCHFALGKAYGENIKGGDGMDAAAKQAAGMNESLIHVDFMVGGPELSIIGVKEDGSRVELLRNGSWAAGNG